MHEWNDPKRHRAMQTKCEDITHPYDSHPECDRISGMYYKGDWIVVVSAQATNHKPVRAFVGTPMNYPAHVNAGFVSAVWDAFVSLSDSESTSATRPRNANTQSAENSVTCTPKSRPDQAAYCQKSVFGTVSAIDGVHNGNTSDAGGSSPHPRGALGRYVIEVRSRDGGMIDVASTPSTIIFPPGTYIQWGMKIKAVGQAAGSVFLARKITALWYMTEH
jgi:hypothetical protein